jgi:hypothetical protein
VIGHPYNEITTHLRCMYVRVALVLAFGYTIIASSTMRFGGFAWHGVLRKWVADLVLFCLRFWMIKTWI